MSTIGILIILLILLVVGRMLIRNMGGGLFAELPSAEDNEQQPPLTPPVVIQEVLAEDLWARYEQGQQVGDAAYLGKTIRITGVIDETGEDLLGAPFVSVQTHGKGYVQCTFDTTWAALIEQLGPGDPLTIQGRVEGLSKSIIVVVGDCEIVQ